MTKRPEPSTGSVRLAPLPAAAFASLLDGDLEDASRAAGVALPPFFLSEGWLWRLRLDQVTADPAAGHWVVRAVVDHERVVGHAGFHGPPDADGAVELGYTIIPECRGRSLGHAALRALLEWAAAEPTVRVVRASVSPDNAPSWAMLHKAGFTRTGQHEDEVDGLEYLYERLARDAEASLAAEYEPTR